ncbi:MarR family transcriptional regulator [Clostridium botulinum C]|uniref:MarR family transcriptional regulator n=4 Tax=Clostridium botulinum TaxID=1491 RepID=A0A9Q4XWT9_CLOBO|nr:MULTISPECIES: MarR family transcriptional regulator [Clostridium]EGO87304.2 MarR family transcriptional regulator [Clostridium botulinum C str. Stockholm]EES90777.1 transcriptional regulator, MarR family [Clostridium botulinum D str. 1873]MBO3440970.1 MarR family transcriptional regulator [Clostridium haemolyticum]MCD3194313.1 MarR family transcriptional regulator [Clostridium botulinum C]MCD3199467.1 MarR family transcriptional regulator [Clostridium botulinum C]
MGCTSGFKIALLIKEINSKINFKVTEELKNIGLTVPQITAIKFIAHRKQVTSSELSEEMSITKATVSGIIDRLEKMNIIKRVRSKEDRRIVYIVFSDEGLNLAKDIRDIMNNCFENIFNNVSEEELVNIENNLSSLLKVVEEHL